MLTNVAAWLPERWTPKHFKRVFGLVIDFGTSKSPYMVSSRFARLNNPNDRDKIASIYPACLRR
ncbi:hypothetical protein, partial [Thiolapillus sp.]|uniref:hypothetical protein n=1 Tax=Thiolapillus sp. TaxID=2017437 RepID=UPI003AF774CD